MKTVDETQQRRTLQLVKPLPMFDTDPLHPELDNPLPPARDDTRPAPRVASDDLFPEEQLESICRECGQQFAALSEYGLCDACLVGYVNGAGELETEDMPPKAIGPRLTNTPCRVCKVRITTLAPARLCGSCLVDLAATRAHVESVLTKAEVAMLDAETHLLACEQCAPAKAQERWERAKTLLAAGPASEAFARTWQAEIAAKSALGVILAAYDALQTAEQSLRSVTEWALAAMSEIEQAEALAQQDEDYAAALALVREAVAR